MLKEKSKLLVLFLSFVLILGASTVVEAQDSFAAGKINLQQVVQHHPGAVEYQAELQEEMMSLQQEFEELMGDLDPEQDEEEMMQIQQQFQQQASMIEQRAEQGLLEVIEPDLEAFREEEGYDLILSDRAVLSGAEDVTEEFIEFVNGEEPELELDLDDDL